MRHDKGTKYSIYWCNRCRELLSTPNSHNNMCYLLLGTPPDRTMAPSSLVGVCIALLLALSSQLANADVFDEFDAMKEKIKEMQAVLDKIGDQQKIIQDMLVRPEFIMKSADVHPRSCVDYLAAGYTANTFYTVWVGEDSALSPLTVYCNMSLGGYIPFLRRDRGPGVVPTHFNRDWTDYEDGFGDGLSDDRSEFWLGLRTLHRLTSGPLTWQLRIDFNSRSKEGNFYIVYDIFRIAGPEDNYRISLSDTSKGNTLDAMMPKSSSKRNNHTTNGKPFSTRDRDHDNYDGQCVSVSNKRGGWWYDACSHGDLTGVYLETGIGGQMSVSPKFDPFYDIIKATASIRPAFCIR